MRSAICLLLASGLVPIAGPLAADTAASGTVAEVSADAPSELKVTIYRDPFRGAGSIDLDRLEGFALVSETRTVHLPAGESRLRFEGVADGIEPSSAIVTGLAAQVLEKNREGALLSPSALVAQAQGKPLVLIRTNSRTGVVERTPGTILSDAEGGVVFRTSEGVEALRCSGLPETFSFEPSTGLSSHPTLSVLARSLEPVSGMVTLSYLARGFDWAANYTATLSADETRMDLGAWVTLANGNGVGFPAAQTQVVAGRVNRENDEVEPIDVGGPILARCWPRGSTSDIPELLQFDSAAALARKAAKEGGATRALAAAPLPQMAAQRVTEEQLGDLKLYRVPQPTTVASRQSKQVRLLDRTAIPVTVVYGADLASGVTAGAVPAIKYLRSVNSTANHLGLPLPSGRVDAFGEHRGLLEHEAYLRDLAVDEELEISLGTSPDVEVTVVKEGTDSERIEIANARARQIRFELRLSLEEGARVVRSDRPMETKNGRPIFRLDVPANSTATLRYQIGKRSS